MPGPLDLTTVRTGTPAGHASPPPADLPPTDAPAGLDAAAAAHPAPSGGGITVGGGRGADALRAVELNSPSLFAGRPYFGLIGARYPDTVGLDTVLGRLAQAPEGRAQLERVLAFLAQRTGQLFPPEVVQAILADPSRIAGALSFTPAKLSQGFDGLVAAFRAGLVQDSAPKTRSLQGGFALEDLAQAPIERPRPEPKPIAPGLWHGDLPSDLPDAKVKANMALAEVFDRLADNTDAFSVRFRGKAYDRLDQLLLALGAAGHSISVEFVHRAANFADLKTKGPDGRWLDVPAGLLVRTGVRALGEEAVVPAAHAEMVIRVRGAGDGMINADVKFYQGMNATGFFGCDVTSMPAWCGWQVGESLRGMRAVGAIRLAGRASDLINSVARERGLPFGGYGITGVCMDSVAWVRHALTQDAGYWPLLMRDAVVAPELRERLADGDRRGDKDFRRLLRSLEEIPADVEANPSALRRMRSSLPWPKGKEPFWGAARARELLDLAR